MEIITRLNWVDILVVIVMLRISYVAFQDGLSREISSLIGAFICLALSLNYYTILSFFICQNIVELPLSILNVVSFLGIFFAVGFIFRMLRIILDKIVKVSWHPVIERVGGLFAGIIKGSLIVSAILIWLSLIPLSYLKWSIETRSLTGPYFLKMGPVIGSVTSGFMPVVKLEAKPSQNEASSKAKNPDWEEPFKQKKK